RLGPAREREAANAFAGVEPSVQQPPQRGPLPLRIALPARIAKREDAFVRPRALFVAARPPERGVETTGWQGVEERVGLQQSATALRADGERLRPVGYRLRVRVDDQARTDRVRL